MSSERTIASVRVRGTHESMAGGFMRYLCLLVMSLSAVSAFSVTLDVPRLPGPSFADGEVSGDAALPAGRTEKLRVWTHLRVTVRGACATNETVKG